jgi:16S rRNA processing protein RimM
VVVASETDFGTERFRAGATVHVQRSGAVEALTIVESREQDNRWIVGFRGIDSIDQAEDLRGLELKVAGEDLHPLGPATYYVHDLVGCEVRTMTGDAVGRVVKVELDTGVPVLVVDGRDGRGEVLVPFVDAICRRVDLAAKRIQIDPPDGLIGLNKRAAGR